MVGWIEVSIGSVTYPELALVGATVLVAGFLRGFIGFGSSMIIVMVVSIILGPLAAVPIANLTGLPALFQLLPNVVRYSQRAFVVPFGLATFVAAPLGALVLVSVEPALMKMAISAFVLAMVAMMYRDWRPAGGVGPGILLGIGVAAGLIQGSSGVGGPPAVAVALSRQGTPYQQRANVIGAVNALSLCGLLPFWYHGLFTREVVTISLVLMPLYIGSTWVGARFFSQRGHRHFRNAALLSLAVIGVLTLLHAVRDYLGG